MAMDGLYGFSQSCMPVALTLYKIEMPGAKAGHSPDWAGKVYLELGRVL
jgi:hypothetical protein